MQLHAHATTVGSLDFAGWAASRQSADAFYRRALANRGQVFFDGSCWLVLDYELIKHIVVDEEHFAAHLEQPQRPIHPIMALLTKQAIFYDGAEHKRIQHVIQAALPRLTRPGSPLLATIDAIVQELLDTVGRHEQMDLAAEFAAPLTDRVMAHVMGISTHEPEVLHVIMEGADAFSDVTSGYLRTNVASIYSLRDALRQVLHEKRVDPGDDLLSAFVGESASADSPVFRDEEELLATAMMLLGAGRVTAKKVIVDGTFLLLNFWQQVRGEVQTNNRRINILIEHLLCAVTPTSYIARWAKQRTQIGGQVIEAGQKVLLFLEAANHLSVNCPPSPEAPLDTQHPLSRPHFPFGPPGDPHFCVGAALAREELRRAFLGLLNRFPALFLQPDAALSFHPNPNVGGLLSLPVCWENA
jgi:cytochrome P450